MTKSGAYLAVILLLVGIVVFQICSNPTEQVNTDIWKQEIHRKQVRIDTLEAQAVKHAQKIKADSVAFFNASQEQENKVKKLSLNLERLKKKSEVQTVIKEVPVIDTIFQKYDSIIAVKDNQLYMANRYISDLRLDIGRLTSNFEERLAVEREKYQDQQAILTEKEKEAQKVPVLKKVIRWIGTALVIETVYLVAKEAID